MLKEKKSIFFAIYFLDNRVDDSLVNVGDKNQIEAKKFPQINRTNCWRFFFQMRLIWKFYWRMFFLKTFTLAKENQRNYEISVLR